MKKLFLFLTLIIFSTIVYCQDEISDSVEIYLIDSFVTPETPHTFILSFFTSLETKSKVVIDDTYEYPVSEDFQETHKTEIDVSSLNFKTQTVPFVIIVEDSLGKQYTEKFDFQLQKEIQVKNESNFLLLCLFGGTVFLLPSPSYVFTNNDSYFSLTKEIPLFSLSKKGFTYPAAYFSAEYSHIFEAQNKNLFRIGYKHIIEIPGIQYLSPGVNGFTNFNGFNGISPELSAGLFRILDTFIVYIRYRYNAKPGEAGSEFQEVSVGLYSNFFSIYF